MSHKIELKPLDELVPNPLNPKAHDEELLGKSLAAFGYVEPIVIDGRTGMMISGHGRRNVLQAIHDEGGNPPEGVTVKGGKWMVPVVTGWSSKDDTEVHAVLVALNRTTERGGWDEDNLLAILQELSGSDALALAGYAEADVAILQRMIEAKDVFTVDVTTAIDEFVDDNAIDPNRIDLQYSSVLRVYFQTEEARQEFFDRIDYRNEVDQKTIRYPSTFKKQAAEQWTG